MIQNHVAGPAALVARIIIDHIIAVVVDTVASLGDLGSPGRVLVIAIVAMFYESWSGRLAAPSVQRSQVEVTFDGVTASGAVVIPVEVALRSRDDRIRIDPGRRITPAVRPRPVTGVAPPFIATRALRFAAGRCQREYEQNGQ